MAQPANRTSEGSPAAVILVSANTEWAEIRTIFVDARFEQSPFGEYFWAGDAIVFHTRCGKIAAAAATQYVIDRWNPDKIVNIGTCGGIAGRIERFAIVLATKTVVYDIAELMSDADTAVAFYSTVIDISWATAIPANVIRAPLYSADRDLAPGDIALLASKFDMLVADWESGAIAWVAGRNGKPVVILRGVSDLVCPDGGQVYGNWAEFRHAAARIMRELFDALPQWLGLRLTPEIRR